MAAERKKTPIFGGNRSLAWGLLLAFLVLGLFLRVWGAGHGLPQRVMHCDTGHQIAMMTVFLRGELAHAKVKGTVLTGYAQPHTYLGAAALAGLRGGESFLGLDPAPLPLGLDRESLPAISRGVMLVRLINAAASILAALFLALAAARLWGPWAGALAAGLIGLDTLSIVQSHFAMPEALQLCFMALCFWLTVLFFEQGRGWQLLAAFLAAGVAGAAKYYGGLVIAAPLLAWFFRKPRRPGLLWAAPLAALLGFVAATPWIWVDPVGWLTAPWGLKFLLEQGSDGAGGLWHALSTFPARWQFLWGRYAGPLVAAWALGFIWLLARRKKEDLPLLALFILGWLLIVFTRANYFRERDMVFLTPFMSLAATGFICWIFNRRKFSGAQKWLKLLRVPALAALLVWQFGPAYTAGYAFHLPDTREQAENWLLARTDRQARILRHPRTSNSLSTRLTGPTTDPAQGEDERYWRAGDLLRHHPQALYLAADHWDQWREEPLVVKGLAPLRIFSSVRASWANPVYYLFRLDGLDAQPNLFPPSVLLAPPTGPVMMNTDFEKLQAVDLVLAEDGQSRADVFTVRPLSQMLALAFGNGRFDFSAGGQTMKLQARPGRPALALFTPEASRLPVGPVARYRLKAFSNGRAGLVRVFGNPAAAAPLLWRLGRWRLLAGLSAPKTDFTPAEFFLLKAAALAKLGRVPESRRLLEDLEKRAPGFAAGYKRAAAMAAGPAQTRAWRPLAGLSPQEMAARSWRLRPAGAAPLPCRADGETPFWGKPLAPGETWQVWNPQIFGPGAYRVRFRLLGPPGGGGGGGAEISIYRHLKTGLLDRVATRRLSPADLPAGQTGEVALDFFNDRGPVGLEFKLENRGGPLTVLEAVVEPVLGAVLN